MRTAAPSFWETPPEPESKAFFEALEVIEAREAAAIAEQVGPGRVAFVGEDARRAPAWGIASDNACPASMVKALDALRTTKTPYEVACIAEANRRARAGHEALRGAFGAGDASELDLHLLFLGATAQDDWETPYKNIVAFKALKKGDHVFLVDGSGYIFRAYHALPPLSRKSDGLQVNAVLGFCNMLWKLLREMPPDNRPTHLAIVFDKSEITFRNEIYPDYKAQRPPAPDDLIPQFPLIREAVRAFDLPCLEQAGFEADDLIATYAREAGERGATTTIVSSDKDLMQLVTDRVTMFDTMKDRRIGIPEVIEKFGVPPEKVVEVQALAGDSTDNVPGVPGIGIKTAAQLIVEYGDLETLLFARRRNQAAEAPRGADRECREGADLAKAGAARRQGQARRAARRACRARARRAQADRIPQGDGVRNPDPPRRRICADRPVRYRARCRKHERRECLCAAAAFGEGRRAQRRRRRTPERAGWRPFRGKDSPRARRRGWGQGRQGREPQGHPDSACQRARRGSAQCEDRARQIPDHPQPRCAQGLARAGS